MLFKFYWFVFQYLKSRTHEAEFSLFKKLFDDGVYIIPGQALFCKEPGWFRLIFTLQPEYVAVGECIFYLTQTVHVCKK